MKAKQQKLPDLSNATPGGIVDMCAPDVTELNRLKKLTEYLKTALKARLDEEFRLDPLTHLVRGEHFCAIISEQTRTGLDLEKVREFLTEEQLDQCVTTSYATFIRFYENGDPSAETKIIVSQQAQKIKPEQIKPEQRKLEQTKVELEHGFDLEFDSSLSEFLTQQ